MDLAIPVIPTSVAQVGMYPSLVADQTCREAKVGYIPTTGTVGLHPAIRLIGMAGLITVAQQLCVQLACSDPGDRARCPACRPGRDAPRELDESRLVVQVEHRDYVADIETSQPPGPLTHPVRSLPGHGEPTLLAPDSR